MEVKVDMAGLGFENICMQMFAVLYDVCGKDRKRALKLSCDLSHKFAEDWVKESGKGSQGDLEDGLNSRFLQEIFLAIPYVVTGASWNLRLLCAEFRDFCAVHCAPQNKYLNELLVRMGNTFEGLGDHQSCCEALADLIKGTELGAVA